MTRLPQSPSVEQSSVMQPRQFAGGNRMQTAHHTVATGQALGRLAGPGGWKHLASFAMGEHLQLNATPFGRNVMRNTASQKAAAGLAAKAAAKIPKPPRISG